MGLGGETLYGLQPALCVWWFEPIFQPAAMATTVTLGSVGESINFIVSPAVVHTSGAFGACFLSTCLCFVSLLASFLLGRLAQIRARHDPELLGFSYDVHLAQGVHLIEAGHAQTLFRRALQMCAATPPSGCKGMEGKQSLAYIAHIRTRLHS